MASAVTYEMVEAVCNHLAATGESPTYLKVHQHLGKGSTRIVSAHIRQWREAHALSQALERDPLFGEWPEALQLKARSLFDALLALSAEAANASADTQRQRFEERERELAAATQAADQRTADAHARLRSEQAETERLTAELRSLHAADQARQAMIADLIAQRAEQTARLAEAAARLDTLRAEHAAQVQQLADAAVAERQRLLDEIRLEQERAAGEREHLMRQTDQLRQDHVVVVEELKQKLVRLEGALAGQRQKNEALETRAAALASARQQLEGEMEKLTRRVAGLEEEVARQQTRQVADAAQLGSREAQLAMLAQQLGRETKRAEEAEKRLLTLLRQATSTAPPAAPAPTGPQGDGES